MRKKQTYFQEIDVEISVRVYLIATDTAGMNLEVYLDFLGAPDAVVIHPAENHVVDRALMRQPFEIVRLGIDYYVQPPCLVYSCTEVKLSYRSFGRGPPEMDAQDRQECRAP